VPQKQRAETEFFLSSPPALFPPCACRCPVYEWMKPDAYNYSLSREERGKVLGAWEVRRDRVQRGGGDIQMLKWGQEGGLGQGGQGGSLDGWGGTPTIPLSPSSSSKSSFLSSSSTSPLVCPSPCLLTFLTHAPSPLFDTCSLPPGAGAAESLLTPPLSPHPHRYTGGSRSFRRHRSVVPRLH
jgi:hypothetical protein